MLGVVPGWGYEDTCKIYCDYKLIVNHSYTAIVSKIAASLGICLRTHSAGPDDCKPWPIAPIGSAPRFCPGKGLEVAMAVSFLRNGALPLVSSASAISSSCDSLLLCPRFRLGATVTPRDWAKLTELLDLGGPGAMGTTPLGFDEVGVVAEDRLLPPADPVDFGDSESAALCDVGVVTGVCAMEFLREDFLDDRVDVVPTGALPLPRLRFLITSVLSDKGRTTPCSFKNRPHALQSGCPSGLRRHNGVV